MKGKDFLSMLTVCLSVMIASCDGKQHEYVDLGLPSGTLWATHNLGASAPEDIGDYYAWGETKPKKDYGLRTYEFFSEFYKEYGFDKVKKVNKYNFDETYGAVDNKAILDSSDDAAYVNWGGKWRMPTIDEWKELCDTMICSSIPTILNGVKGFKVTSVKNGNSIFLPITGWRRGSELWHEGEIGYYWSSSRDPRDVATSSRCLHFDDVAPVMGWGINIRSDGLCIRPVRRP